MYVASKVKKEEKDKRVKKKQEKGIPGEKCVSGGAAAYIFMLHPDKEKPKSVNDV